MPRIASDQAHSSSCCVPKVPVDGSALSEVDTMFPFNSKLGKSFHEATIFAAISPVAGQQPVLSFNRSGSRSRRSRWSCGRISRERMVLRPDDVTRAKVVGPSEGRDSSSAAAESLELDALVRLHARSAHSGWLAVHHHVQPCLDPPRRSSLRLVHQPTPGRCRFAFLPGLLSLIAKRR